MKIKGAIFDMDGTLLDSMFVWDTVGEEYLINRGLVPEDGLNERFKVMSLMAAAVYYQDVCGITDSIETIIKDIDKMAEHQYFHVVLPRTGIVPLLERMKADGVRMCVATATDRYMAEAALKRNGLMDYFCAVLTCNEIGHGKDEPVIFERAHEQLGTEKSDTWVFEDSLYAIETAKKSGFKVLGVFDQSCVQNQARIKEQADIYVTSFENWSEWYD